MKQHLILRRILTLVIVAALVFGSVPGISMRTEAAGKQPSLNAKKITIAKGMRYKLKVKNKGSSVKWSSSNKKVAKVTKTGKVIGKKDGKATIKATVKKGGKKKVLRCKVTVKTPAFEKSQYQINTGDQVTLTIKNKYKKSTYKWISSNTSVAKVDSKGVVTGVSQGNTTISCTIKIPKKGNRMKKKLTIKTQVTVGKKGSDSTTGSKGDTTEEKKPETLEGDEDEHEVSAPDLPANNSEKEAQAENSDKTQNTTSATDGTADSSNGTKSEAQASSTGKDSAVQAAEAGEKTSGSWNFFRCSWDKDESRVVMQSDTCEEAYLLSEAGNTWTSGWYVLDQKIVTINDRIEVTGDVHLILTDGNGLYANGGIRICSNSSLSIYGQNKDSLKAGKIIANIDRKSGVGIGTATEGDSGGALYIHGGEIRAYGGKNDAGIGSGDKKDCIDITMYAGEVFAEGGDSAAGIGDGRGVENSGTINLYGGKVTAYGGHYAAGIGGGNRVNGKGGHHNDAILIYGCDVYAYGGDDGAGIGGGEGGHCGGIKILGSEDDLHGYVYAKGGNNAAGIGNGECESTGDGGYIEIDEYANVEAHGGGDGAGIGGGDNGRVDRIIIKGGKVKAYGGSNAAGIGGGDDAHGSGTYIRIQGGDVWAWGKDGAGIGGGEGEDGGEIQINGGKVHAYGGGNKQYNSTGNGAGIGGGNHGGDGGHIVINGGTVYAESIYGAGIGGGRAKEANDRSGKGGNITINGGDVTAQAMTFGIGCGASEEEDIDLHRLTMNSIGTFNINGGYVKAYGKAAGIGGYNGTFNMNGGELLADGRGQGAGIWFTYYKNNDDVAHINFTGGTSIIRGYDDGGIMTGEDTEEGNFNQIKIKGRDTYVYVSCTGTEAGIGGRRKGPIVKIHDFATVRVRTQSNQTKSIGGHNGLYATGTLNLYPEAQVVLQNRSLTPVPKDERVDACHYKKNSFDLLVQPCEDTDHERVHTYTVTEDGEHHKRTCKYCKTKFPEEDHVYSEDDPTTCTLCGHVYTGEKFEISFDPGEGKGSEESMQVPPHYEYTLPECSFTAPSSPEGSAFYRWQVIVGDDGQPTNLKPGETVKIEGNTIIKALWHTPCMVTYKTGLSAEDETFKNIVKYGNPAEEPERPEKEGQVFKYWRLEDASPDTPYDFDQEVEKDITLIAEWSDQPVKIESLSVLRDSEGNVTAGVGTVEISPDTLVAAGTEVTLTASLQENENNKYSFDGWYWFKRESKTNPFVTLLTKATDSTEQTYTFDATQNQDDAYLIAAVYTLKENAKGTITLDSGMSHGSVEVTNGARYIEDGTTYYDVFVDREVTLKVKADKGYWPESVYYTYDYYYPGSKTPTKMGREVYPDEDGNCTFTPPATDMTLYAEFDDQEYTLALYSTDTGCRGSVTNVGIFSDKDTFKAHEKVTLVAPAPGDTEDLEGYDFMGWYPVTEVTDGQVTAYDTESILSDKPTFEYEIGQSNEQLVAVYRAHDGNALVKVEPINGAEFKAQGHIGGNEDPETIYDHTSQFMVPTGNNLKLTATEPDSVLQWENESHKILGSSASLDHYVTSNTAISLVYKTETNKKTYLQFVSDYGQVLSYQMITNESDIVYPAIPTKIGYKFEKWVFEGTEDEAVEEDIWARTGDTKLITVKPMYEKEDTTATINVTHMQGTLKHRTYTYDIQIGDTKTLSPINIDGYTFHHWEDQDENVLGYTREYFIKITGNRDIYACYEPTGTAVEEAKPVITMSDLMALESGETHKVYGVATRSIPEGYTLIEHGVLYSYDSKISEDDFVYTDGSNGIRRYVSIGKNMIGSVGVSLVVKSDDTVVSMKGYMLLRDKDGKEEYYFTKKIEGSYGDLK